MMILIVALSVPGFRSDPPGEAVNEAQLLADFRTAAIRFHEATTRVRVEHNLLRKQRENDIHRVHLIDGECESLGLSDLDTHGLYTDGVSVLCGSRRFIVSRKSPDAAYSLRRKDLDEGVIRSMARDRSEVIEAPYVIGSWEASRSYGTRGTFKFLRASRRSPKADSPPVIEADFEINWGKEGTRAKGSVKLDPSRQLAILSHEYILHLAKPSAPTLSEAVEIQYSSDPGSNVPTKIVRKRDKDGEGKYRINNTYEIIKWQYGSISPEMFTLAHYGLGDVERPVTMAPRRRVGPYWFLGVAVAGIITVGVTRWITRRRAPHQTTP